MLPSCLFCAIARGTTPAHRVLESEAAVAFLDTRPLFRGHTLLVPRDHVETLADLPPTQIGPLFAAVQRLSAAVERACIAEGSFVAMNNRVSQSVPHLHVHIVPRKKGDGLKGFFWPRQRYDGDGAMAEVARAIRAELEKMVVSS
jgi:histidine triad (HIT) family protein